MPRKRTPFAARVDKNGPIPSHRPEIGPCWLITGAVASERYVNILTGHSPRQVQGAHRVSWVIHYGPIPAGMFVCHACDNPRCVRPDHLFLGTSADNTNDMKSKGNSWQHRGIANRSARLTEQQVREIRRLHAAGVKQAEISRQFSMSPMSISQIVRRLQWTHVE
jgi:hypothetical protein